MSATDPDFSPASERQRGFCCDSALQKTHCLFLKAVHVQTGVKILTLASWHLRPGWLKSPPECSLGYLTDARVEYTGTALSCPRVRGQGRQLSR